MDAPIVRRINYFPTIVLALLTKNGSYTVKGYDTDGNAIASVTSSGSAEDVRATLHRKLDEWLDYHGAPVKLTDREAVPS